MKRFIVLFVVLFGAVLSCKDNSAEANPDQSGNTDAGQCAFVEIG